MDRYVLRGRIGEGAHGVVFQATNAETGVMVALKKVSLGRADTVVTNRVLREIKALKVRGLGRLAPAGQLRRCLDNGGSVACSKSASTSTS